MKSSNIKTGGLQILTAGDTKQETWSVLVYGFSGVGKTALGASAKKPLFLLTEKNGAQTIRATNPNAGYIHIDNIAALREAVRMAEQGAFKEYDVLVIDSLTEAQRLILDEIFNPDLKDNMPLGDWQILSNRTRNLIRRLRNCGMNILCICLCDKRDNDNLGTSTYRPLMSPRKMADEVAQFFNAVGYAYKTTKKNPDGDGVQVEYGVAFDGTTNFLTKSVAQLTGVQPTDLQLWETLFNPASDEKSKQSTKTRKEK